ncbi:hypothetical protein LAZ67_13001548 [Cordylochernes scorpioides]|uniref:DUF5641 domain-containing protein n=1 Tax=Cordylochernes scorpioides TaxID=51811 RepID=A0ABY6L7W3_9ARAC|nr:hypothetical protein LAZ67_13001548 [Cordylochernes scorpioides]
MEPNPTTQKLRYLNRLREELKSRFRKKYWSLLVQRNRRIYNPKLQAADVVLVGMDNKKRIFWPLAVIEEVLFGRDGVNRLVKVRTSRKTGGRKCGIIEIHFGRRPDGLGNKGLRARPGLLTTLALKYVDLKEFIASGWRRRRRARTADPGAFSKGGDHLPGEGSHGSATLISVGSTTRRRTPTGGTPRAAVVPKNQFRRKSSQGWERGTSTVGVNRAASSAADAPGAVMNQVPGGPSG